jgi:hypothetical protein
MKMRIGETTFYWGLFGSTDLVYRWNWFALGYKYKGKRKGIFSLNIPFTRRLA